MKVKLLNNLAVPLWGKAMKGRELLSISNLSERVIQNGRQLWEYVLQKSGRVPRIISNKTAVPKRVQQIQVPTQTLAWSEKVFAGLFLRGWRQTFAAEWRRRAAFHLISGPAGNATRRLPLFAFVGLAFTAKTDVSEKNELFAQIRELHCLDKIASLGDEGVEKNHVVHLGDLDFGQLIGKGCNAAVHEARFVMNRDVIQDGSDEDGISVCEESSCEMKNAESDTDMAPMAFEDSDSDFSILDSEEEDLENQGSLPVAEHLHINLLHGEFGTDEKNHADDRSRNTSEPDGKFDLAVKMMFNYDVESNADAVARAMEKETIPLSLAQLYEEKETWHNGNRVKNKNKLMSVHPNIVEMYGMFVDCVPDLPTSSEHYPDALPTRINPDGFGRNLTMFLVMKRYTCTLTEYLAREDPSTFTRCLLLAQLLEGIVFLQTHDIAHRDLKSDNLLVDLSQNSEVPVLVISDFGCCLRVDGLKIPHETSEINKGGNAALMAPEIACAEAGKKSVLDYTKADVWAVGAVAYEIFGLDNPFYRSRTNPTRLDSRTYREENLPDLPDSVPSIVKNLVHCMLIRDNRRRMSASVAATILQLYLWLPPQSLQLTRRICINNVQDWLVDVAAKVSCFSKMNRVSSNVMNTIKQTFLSRISHDDLRSAVLLLQEM